MTDDAKETILPEEYHVKKLKFLQINWQEESATSDHFDPDEPLFAAVDKRKFLVNNIRRLLETRNEYSKDRCRSDEKKSLRRTSVRNISDSLVVSK